MNSRATLLTVTGKNPAGDAARLHPISPALISGNPPENKSASGDPFAASRIKKNSAPTRVRTRTNQKFFALKEPIYEGT
jgi:hypothetical protein